MIALDHIDGLTGGRIGQFDLPCPLCGPQCRSPGNQRRKVLRIWRIDPSFAGFHCARCGEKGHAHDVRAPSPDPVKLVKARAEVAERERIVKGERLGMAQWLWSRRKPISRTIAERYLREARAYGGTIPATLAFLPGRGDFPPSMIAAFGFPTEIEPGVVSIASAVHGVHLTRLASDGLSKAGTDADKIMIGTPRGVPIALASPNDLNGIAITEGIEDALSVHEATGLGVWAAGSASFMPALAKSIPPYVESCTIIADPDAAGQRFASELKARVAELGFDNCMLVWGAT
jgi:hypothetical protein